MPFKAGNSCEPQVDSRQCGSGAQADVPHGVGSLAYLLSPEALKKLQSKEDASTENPTLALDRSRLALTALADAIVPLFSWHV